MTLGLLPALGGGLGELASTGQAGRLLDGYLARYVKVFDRVLYFSYRVESLEQFTRDPALLAHAQVVAPARPLSRGRRAATLAWTESARLRACAVLRVFQVTGTVPALAARARFGVPYVTTYGFGNNVRPGTNVVNQLVGPEVFGELDRQMRANIERQRAKGVLLDLAVHRMAGGGRAGPHPAVLGAGHEIA